MAVKVLDAARCRHADFVRELHILAKLQHPRIVQLKVRQTLSGTC